MTTKERRNHQRSLADLVGMLEASQSYKLGEYLSEGGELDFVRQTEQGPLAVCHKENELVTIDCNGVVDDHPDIKLRGS